MTVTIPAKPLTGTSLRAAWYECRDRDVEETIVRCGYVDANGFPMYEAFEEAIRQVVNSYSIEI
jgi:hypothetical protein